MKLSYFFLIPLLINTSCKDDVLPKPNAYLKMQYPKSNYQTSQKGFPFQFEYSSQAVFSIQKNLWSDLHYPKLKADINITYQKVNNNLLELITDAEKLTYKHTLKADDIEMHPYEDVNKKVYARLFELSGNAASPIQFQVTDSLKHFISGSLYFDVRPNYDSIIPAIDYLKKDIQHLIETLEWKN